MMRGFLSNRIYRLIFGIALLLALYFDQHAVTYGLIALALTEAVTNLRIPLVVSRIRNGYNGDCDEGSLGIRFKVRSNFEAERAWRLSVSIMLIVSTFAYPHALWFFPWFMGFAILGAGISGVCPVFLALKWAGLK
jgi:hypothetical protein